MVKKIHIHKHEVGLWFRHGDFRDVLGAGRHWSFGFLRNHVEVYDAAVAKFDHPKLEVLVAEPVLAAKLTDTQRALVWKDRRLGWILGRGRHAFWKESAKIEVEVFDVSDFKFEHPKIDVILGHPGGVRSRSRGRTSLCCDLFTRDWLVESRRPLAVILGGHESSDR